MTKNLTSLTCPDLISARTPARVAEATRRLAQWDMSPKNVRRLQAFVSAKTAAAKSAPKVKSARPTGPGSRGGDPAKAARMALARQIAADAGIVPFAGDRQATSKFWAIYASTK